MMKKFLYKSIIFIFIFSLGIIIINILKKNKVDHTGYLAAIIDKHERVDSIKTPKIIFAGGSNLAFGVNCKWIQKEFSIPVVNLGLIGGLGLTYMIEELKQSINKNDIVLLSLEYFLSINGDYNLQVHIKELLKSKNIKSSDNLLTSIMMYLENTRYKFKKLLTIEKKEIIGRAYFRKAFNKYGDVDTHSRNRPPLLKLDGRHIIKYEYWRGIESLNKFYEYAKKKEVKVFYLFPNYALSQFQKNKKAIKLLEADLRNKLKIEILNKPSDFAYSDNLFYDTVYHLNKKGRNIRTRKLMQLLKSNKNTRQAIDLIQKK